MIHLNGVVVVSLRISKSSELFVGKTFGGVRSLTQSREVSRCCSQCHKSHFAPSHCQACKSEAGGVSSALLAFPRTLYRSVGPAPTTNVSFEMRHCYSSYSLLHTKPFCGPSSKICGPAADGFLRQPTRATRYLDHKTKPSTIAR